MRILPRFNCTEASRGDSLSRTVWSGFQRLSALENVEDGFEQIVGVSAGR
jgi:hypothetical protein